MWLCSNCGETHEETFEACWKCGANRLDTAATPATSSDEELEHGVAIDRLVAQFFAAFSNTNGGARVRDVYALCVPQAVITKAVSDVPEIYLLHEFVEPRVALLASGTLVDFVEHETSHDTFISGHVAQRRSSYQKSGVQNGERFTVNGVKVFQFVNTAAGWKITAVAWDDVDT